MADLIRAATRPLVTLIFAGSVCAGFFIGMVPLEPFLGIAGAVILWWFGGRQWEKAKEMNNAKWNDYDQD
jgi:uncharacterized membrane protein